MKTQNHKKARKRSSSIRTDEEIVWICQYCGGENSVEIDFTASLQNDIIEECYTCCRPNRLIISLDENDRISAETMYID